MISISFLPTLLWGFSAFSVYFILLLRFILQNYNKKTKSAKDLTFTP